MRYQGSYQNINTITSHTPFINLHLHRLFILHYIHSLTSTTSSSSLCISTRHLLNLLASSCNLTLTWIKGHSNIPGNDRADTLAKEGTTSNTLIVVPLPRSVLKNKLNLSSYQSLSDSISSSTSSNPLKPLISLFASHSYKSYFKTLQRRNTRLLTSFLDNRAPLRYFLSLIHKIDDPYCTYCFGGIQTNAHLLLDCPTFTHQRSSIFGSFFLHTHQLSRVTPELLLDFIHILPLYDCFAYDDDQD